VVQQHYNAVGFRAFIIESDREDPATAFLQRSFLRFAFGKSPWFDISDSSFPDFLELSARLYPDQFGLVALEGAIPPDLPDSSARLLAVHVQDWADGYKIPAKLGDREITGVVLRSVTGRISSVLLRGPRQIILTKDDATEQAGAHLNRMTQ
jgi:hypothetical protein